MDGMTINHIVSIDHGIYINHTHDKKWGVIFFDDRDDS